MVNNPPDLDFDIFADSAYGRRRLFTESQRLMRVWPECFANRFVYNKPHSSYLLNLALVDDARIQALNKHYRSIDKPTNVLSFTAPETAVGLGEPFLLGDVVLSSETCRREARQANMKTSDYLLHLMLHGLLHVLGHDHETDEEAMRMEALEIKILSELNINLWWR